MTNNPVMAITRGMLQIVSATFIFAFSGSAQGQTSVSISLADAVRMALQSSAVKRGADARVQQMAAKLRGASLPQNPTLSVAHGAGKDTGGLDEDILATQILEIGEKRRQRVRGAKAERDAAVADRADKVVDVEFNARNAYFAALRSDAEYKLASGALDNARAFLNTAQLRFQAGDVPRAEVVRSQVELSRAEQGLAATESDRLTKYATLKSLIGASADAALTLTDPLGFDTIVVSLPALRDFAVKHRPDILSAIRTRDARKAAVGSAQAQRQPDLFIEGRHADITQYPDGNSVRAGITFPIFDYGRTRADVQAAKAALTEQEATLQETTRTALLEVETAFRELEQARKSVESFRSGRLERSTELLGMAQIGYQRGANTFLELLDAQQVYRNEQADYARALAAYNTAKASLRKAVGGTLP